MNFKLICGTFLALSSVVAVGCATSDEGTESGDQAVVARPQQTGACLRVDANTVHSHINVRTSPDIPETRFGEEENVRATLPPSAPMMVLAGQTVGSADPRENGWWYLVEFRLPSGALSEGWVKGQYINPGFGPDCDTLSMEPPPAPPSTTVEPGMCIRLIEGDAQARGLVLRSSPGIDDGFPSNRIGLLGPSGAARYQDHVDTFDGRDWFLVNIRDAADGRMKQGYVSGRGNFTYASEFECNGIP